MIRRRWVDGLLAGGALACALACAQAQPVAPTAPPAARSADTADTAKGTDDEDVVRDSDRTDTPEPAAQRSLFDSGVTTLEAGASGTYRLEVRAPGDVRPLLVQHLDLARFHGQADISPIEVARLMSATPAEARSLLEPAGFFEAQVDVSRQAGANGGPPTVIVRVDPGTPVRVRRVQLDIQGPFADAMGPEPSKDGSKDGTKEGSTDAAPGNAPASAEAQALRRRWQRLQSRWTLPVGAVFSQSEWNNAKNALLASLVARGYANASFAGTGAEVDVERRSVRLSAVVDSGPLYRIGSVRIEGLERTPEQAALNLMPFQTGVVFSDRLLLDYQEALQKSGLFEGVAVELDLQSPDPGQAVVVARLREQPLQNATVSVGFSTNTGPRVGLEHTHRRIFGSDLIGTTQIKYGQDERIASFDLLTYPLPEGRRNLLGVRYEYLDAGGALTVTQSLRAGRQRETQTLNRLYYLEYLQTKLETATTSGTDRALYANSEWVRRDVNNLTFPTRGLILSAQGGGGMARGADGQRGPFGRLYASAVWYQPVLDGWIAQLRGEFAQVFKKDTQGVPDTLLFRAGGDDSVRGYGYRTLGPVRDGAVVGGPLMATGSVELMRQFSRTSARWRDWYGAVFVDAGNAATNWNELNPVFGYGVGVRWRSPIGPLKVDLAYGQEVKAVRLHVSVGVSF